VFFKCLALPFLLINKNVTAYFAILRAKCIPFFLISKKTIIKLL
jgi:hypothetical protein